MEVRSGVWLLVQALVVVAILALLAGQFLGQPILLGFVETGSMEPTIETGDGFVSIPAPLADEPEPGDVVVFDAQELQGGGLTTHRIVEETDAGYVTRGDANPFTDQDGGEPPVQDAQIVAHAWQIGDTVVTIPSLGAVVMGVGTALAGVQQWLAMTLGLSAVLDTAGLAYVILGVSALLYAVETVRERRAPGFDSRLDGRSESTIDRLDPRWLAGGFALLIVIAAAATMFVPAGTYSYDVVSADFDSDRPLVIERGTTDELAYEIPNSGLVPMVSYVESSSDRVATDGGAIPVDSRGDAETTVAITAPEETGYYPTYVTEHRYLHVLPLGLIDALYEVHPWVPALAIFGLLGGSTYALARRLLGRATARSRRRASRRRRASSRSRLRRRS